MSNLKFETLEECIEFYKRENLIAINNLKQIFYYIQHKHQPKFVSEYENKITCWFLKSETSEVYKLWQNSNPKKENKYG